MDELDLLVDLHLRNARQAPGSRGDTERALAMTGLDPDAPRQAADLGCGTGASALVLAGRMHRAMITCVDTSAAFIERLRRRADDAGVADRIDARVGDMGAPPIDDGSLDLLWCEGAIYNIGFDTGIRAWSRLLKPGGVLVVSELAWTTPERPDTVTAYWEREYPGIRTHAQNLESMGREGYRVLGSFLIPESSWSEGYHEPLQSAMPGFLTRHGRDERARAIVEHERREAEFRRKHGEWFGYAFIVARLDRGGPTHPGRLELEPDRRPGSARSEHRRGG